MGSLVSTSAANAATAAGLSSIHDLKVVSPGDAASQAGLHIGKVEQVTKKEAEKKVEEVGKKRGI
jgi:hypothetical protein